MNPPKTPRPSIRIAVLPSEGLGKRRATKHVYVDTRPTMTKNSDGEAASPAWEHIFKCEETGVERRWGIECRSEFAVPPAPSEVV